MGYQRKNKQNKTLQNWKKNIESRRRFNQTTTVRRSTNKTSRPLHVTMEGFQGAVGGAKDEEEAVIVGADGQHIGDKEEVDERSDALKKAEEDFC